VKPSAAPDAAIGRLRKICLALPETTEKLSHGEPTWFAGAKGRVFVSLSNHHHDDRLGFWCAAPPGEQQALVSSAPGRFFVPPYVGHKGWLGVYLDVGDVDWPEVAELVEESYRFVAAKKLLAQLDAR
jgi:hypothetical protein